MTNSESPGQPPPDDRTHFAWLRTRMAAERTLESWVRTSISLIAFGFTIVLFFSRMDAATNIRLPHPKLPRYIGLVMIGIGTLGLALSVWQYQILVNYLRAVQLKHFARIEGMPQLSAALVVAWLLCFTGIITFLIILLRFR